MTIEFTIYGTPVPQGRPRFFRRGDFVGAYDPAKSKDYKRHIQFEAKKHKPPILEGPLKMYLFFMLPRPKSLPKKVLHHVKKPDLSNLVKGIEDALNGICYQDDSQIVEVHHRKDYGGEPGVWIKIEPVDGSR